MRTLMCAALFIGLFGNIAGYISDGHATLLVIPALIYFPIWSYLNEK